ncbi:MAG TPA: hypothetical protein VJW94_03395 [Candidatus Acidoferrum sp.]|nr:hypothetical protein [Candidatus Acidoferrum sp.]
MRIDKTHRIWSIVTGTIIGTSTAFYLRYALSAPEGPRGGSAIGIGFGVIGFGLMIFAALLGARKRVPTWRIGRAQAWMRGHLWLGFLSLPMILFHGGFHFGGTLTSVLMWLLIITVVSGVFGAAVQHYVPRVMTTDVKLETIYDEIGNVRKLLREEADRGVEAICGPLGIGGSTKEEVQRAGGFSAARTTAATSSGAAVAAAAETAVLTEEECAPLRKFYLGEMRPFLEQPKLRGSRLGDADKAHSAFSGLRTLMPQPAQATVQDLEDICDEARQLVRQERLHHLLHVWLLVHIPLSLALILLGAVHAVMALRY